MSLRNENIGAVVTMMIAILGCWIVGWDPSDQEGAVIVTVAFFAGFATFTIPFERERRRRADRQR